MSSRLPGLLALVLVSFALPVAAEIRIAVASNFRTAAELLVSQYQDAGGETVTLAVGSSGKHFAQIMNGAPFDALLSADSARPQALEKAGRAVAGSRFTYAIGQLVLWSPDPDRVDPDGAVLSSKDVRRLAVANPRLAPYGLAARQALQALGQFNRLQKRLVQGENINQAFQFVVSGNADMGLIAASQVAGRAGGSRWDVPAHLHGPIEQQAVRLSASAAAADFLAFIVSPDGRRIIKNQGYSLADDQQH